MLTVLMCFVVLLISPASALQLNPADFVSLGALNTTADLVINIDTRHMTGGATATGVLDQGTGATVFTFDSIQAGNISITGTTPLALLSNGNVTLDGLVTSAGALEIASATTVNLQNGTVLNGGSLSIYATEIDIFQDVQLATTNGGPITLATTAPWLQRGSAPATITLTSASSSSNLFQSFLPFNVTPADSLIIVSPTSDTSIVPRVTLSGDGTTIFGSVPEPASLLLLGAGLAGIVGFRRKM